MFLEDSGDDSLVLGGRGGSHYHEDIIHLPKDAIRLWIAVDEFRELFAGNTNTTAATAASAATAGGGGGDGDGGGGGSMILRGRYGGGGGRDRDVTDVLDEQKRAESAWIINTYIDYEDFSAGAALTGASRKAGKAGETRKAAGAVTEASKANWGKLQEGISTPADKLSAKRRPVLFVKHICDDEMLTEGILAGRGRPTKDMFAPLMEKVAELMQEKLLPLFFRSSTFTEYEVSDEETKRRNDCLCMVCLWRFTESVLRFKARYHTAALVCVFDVAMLTNVRYFVSRAYLCCFHAPPPPHLLPPPHVYTLIDRTSFA